MPDPIMFALVREGTSDDGLIPILRTLLSRAGAPSVLGAARSYKGTVQERLSLVLQEPGTVDLIFVHRDADAPSPEARREEILSAANALQPDSVVVPVVPVQELEAWLLTDEAAIRTIAGKPSGKAVLGIPKVSAIENCSDPKATLKAALLEASETKGARRKKHIQNFGRDRSALLTRLDLDGSVNSLPSWRQLVSDVEKAVQDLLAR